MKRVGALLLVLVLVVPACIPAFDERESLVTGPRILAVRGDPPEARPGESVAYTALVVDPEGTRSDADLGWAFCAAPKPLTENNAVNAACLGDAVRPIGSPAPSVTAEIPSDACALFGPDTPPGDLRPRDPDITGGFYQPVRAEALGITAFALERITCNLPGAPIEIAVELEKRYSKNRNPALLPLVAKMDGAPVELDALTAGREVLFEVAWGADDAETYPVFDSRARAIVEQQEAIRVSWYTTAGELESDVTGVATGDMATSTSNRWRAPVRAGRVFLWLVARDSRGGVDFATYEIEVASE